MRCHSVTLLKLPEKIALILIPDIQGYFFNRKLCIAQQKNRHLKSFSWKKYINDYKIQIFEVAWLTEEEIERFQSDFRIVANFFAQKRKNKDYIPDDPTEIKYVDEVLKLLNVMTGDKRYEKIFQKKKGVRSMCDVAERLEKMGIVKGIEIGRLEGKEEGKVEGKAEGKAEGILEGKMQVYRNLLKKGFTEKEAREITEIS